MGRSWAESHFLSKAKSQRIGLPFYQKAHLREQKALNNEVWAAGWAIFHHTKITVPVNGVLCHLGNIVQAVTTPWQGGATTNMD